MPDLAPSKAEVGAALQAQFPQVQDVSNDQMVEAMHHALQTSQGQFSLTLIALDEMQAFIGDNSDRAREEAARLLTPQAVKAHLPKRTLHTEQDLHDWLSEVEEHLKDQLHNGPVMI
jgi:hypothetical protein